MDKFSLHIHFGSKVDVRLTKFSNGRVLNISHEDLSDEQFKKLSSELNDLSVLYSDWFVARLHRNNVIFPDLPF